MTNYYDDDFINKYEKYDIKYIVECYELYIKKEMYHKLFLSMQDIYYDLVKHVDTLETFDAVNKNNYKKSLSIIKALYMEYKNKCNCNNIEYNDCLHKDCVDETNAYLSVKGLDHICRNLQRLI